MFPWLFSSTFMKFFFCGTCINTTEQNFLKSSCQVLRKQYILFFLQNAGKIPQKIPDRWRKSGICCRNLLCFVKMASFFATLFFVLFFCWFCLISARTIYQICNMNITIIFCLLIQFKIAKRNVFSCLVYQFGIH